jgi:hypothetical protein
MYFFMFLVGILSTTYIEEERFLLKLVSFIRELLTCFCRPMMLASPKHQYSLQAWQRARYEWKRLNSVCTLQRIWFKGRCMKRNDSIARAHYKGYDSLEHFASWAGPLYPPVVGVSSFVNQWFIRFFCSVRKRCYVSLPIVPIEKSLHAQAR